MTCKFNEARTNAEELLSIFRIYKPPIPNNLVSKIFSNAQIAYMDFNDNIYGCCYSDSGRWQVFINNAYSRETQRITLFHELYHMLHGKPAYCKRTIPGTIEEFLADIFAADLLMPYKWFYVAWERTRDEKRMAELFGVSKREVIRRLDLFQTSPQPRAATKPRSETNTGASSQNGRFAENMQQHAQEYS